MKKWPVLLILALPLASRAYDNISLSRTVAFEKDVKEPAGVLVTRSGNILVSDLDQGRVAVYDAQGKLAGTIGAKGKGPGQLNGPRGLAEDRDGNLYVADSGNDRVQVFSPEGKFLRTVGVSGAGAGQLASPSAVAVTHDGFLFVSDTGNDRVQIFSREGVYFHGFGQSGTAPGQFKEPADVAVTATGQVVVLDKGNNRLQKFAPSGRFLGVVGGPGKTGKESDALPEPAAVAVDGYGFLYAADAQQAKIKEFGSNGDYVGVFGTRGTGPGQFKKVSGMAVSSVGEVVVLDPSLRRAQSFKLDSAEKLQRQSQVPTLRLRVEPLPPIALDVDDLVFSSDTLVGVSTKGNWVVLAGGYGKQAPRTISGKGKGAAVSAPRGAAAAGGTVYIADGGNRRVLMWDAQAQPVGPGQIGGAGKHEGQFKAPQAVAVDGQGRLFVVDPTLARCQVFGRDGIFLYAVGSEGAGAGQFTRPVDVAALGDRIAVVDAERKALIFYDSKGKFLSEVTGQFVNPVSVAVDSARKSPFFYVLDAGTGQVKAFKDNGQFVAAFGSSALFTAPKAVAVDDQGRLWVADAGSIKPFGVTLIPAAPADLKAVPGEGEIALRWSPDAEKLAAGYAVYRATAPLAELDAYQSVPSTAVAFIDVEIVPGLTYYYAVAPLSDPVAGGRGLEGPRAFARTSTVRPANLPSLDITSLALENIFSAQYKYYVDHAVGRVVVKNNTVKTFQKIRVGFIIQDFMDYPTEAVVDRLGAGAPAPLDLKAVFNNKILSVSEDTPIQAQVTVTYYEDGAEKIFKRTQSFTLYSRNAMSWDDPRRIATFVTPKDPPVLEFGRGVAKSFEEETETTPLNPSIVRAAAVFDALGVHGLSYLKDPSNPYEKAVQDVKAVDYVQYPRETLKRKTGDCDDLVNLYASLLESVSIPTALLDVPGHILLMFKTDDAASEALGLPDDLVVTDSSGSWIPVEVTFVGKPFEEAWREGAKVRREAAAEDKVRVIDTHEAWRVYAPATLPEEPAVAAPSKDDIKAKFPDDLEKTAAHRLDHLVAELKKKLDADPKDEDAHLQLGILYATHNRLKESGEWLDKLLALNPDNAAAVNDRANLYFLQDDMPKAKEFYEKAVKLDPKDGDLQLNLARAAVKAGDKAAAEKALQQAFSLKPDLKKDVKTLDDLTQ